MDIYDSQAQEIQYIFIITNAFKCFSSINSNKVFIFACRYTLISHSMQYHSHLICGDKTVTKTRLLS